MDVEGTEYRWHGDNGFQPDAEGLCSEEGSSLAAVLAVVTLILTVVGLIMLAFLQQGYFIRQDLSALQARYTAESGIFHFLSETEWPPLTDEGPVEVFLLDSSRVRVLSRPFGGFLHMKAIADEGANEVQIESLMGIRPPESFENAIVAGDPHTAVTVTGNTVVEGDVSVGPLGLEEADFQGELFSGRVAGTVQRHDSIRLPPFDTSFLDLTMEEADSLGWVGEGVPTRIGQNEIDLSRLGSAGSSVFFREGNLTITSGEEVFFEGNPTLVVTDTLILQGPMEIPEFARFHAGGPIVFRGRVEGGHALFYSQSEILVRENVHLSAQLLSRREIHVQSGAYLRYPSLLYAEGITGEDRLEGTIRLDGNARLDGMAIMPGSPTPGGEDRRRVVVDSGAVVRGAIYSGGRTEVQGTVEGSVLTFQFYYYESPTTYINWLKDATIARDGRPERFVVPLGFTGPRAYEYLTWEEQ